MDILLRNTCFLHVKEMPKKISRPAASKHDVDFKLGVLRKSRRLMNVSQAASESGVSRTTIYRWNTQFTEFGEKGLEAKKQSKPRHSQRVAEAVEPVLALAKTHPDWGCGRIVQELNSSGIEISSPSVQKMLIEYGLANQADRSRRLECDWGDGKITPTAEQYRAMLKHNPCLGDRIHYQKTTGVQVIGVGIYPLKGLSGVPPCSIVVLIDLASLVANCIVWDENRDRQSLQALQEKTRQNVGLFRDSRKQPLHVIYSTKTAYAPNPFENIIKIQSTKISGGVEQIGAMRYFFRLLSDTFVPTVRDNPKIVGLDRLGQQLQAWLDEYNMKQKRTGFPTFGFTPQECKSQIKYPASFCRPFPLSVPSA